MASVCMLILLFLIDSSYGFDISSQNHSVFPTYPDKAFGLNEDNKTTIDTKGNNNTIKDKNTSDKKFQFMGEDILHCDELLCTKTRYPVECQCDKECLLFGDCCVDAFSNVLGFNDSLDILMKVLAEPVRWYKDHVRDPDTGTLLLLRKYGECNLLSATWTTAISNCPEHYQNEEIRKRCHGNGLTAFQNIPLSARYVPEIVFRNIYCAMCHEWHGEKLIYWKTIAECPSSVSVNETNVQESLDILSSDCNMGYKLPQTNLKVRHCLPQTYLRCSDNFHFVNESILCNSYNAPFDTYANQHCVVCNNATIHQADCDTRDSSLKEEDTHGGGFDLGTLFKIELNWDKEDNDDSLYICGDSKYKDVVKEKCRNFVCPVGFIEVDYTCVGMTEKWNISYDIPYEKKYVNQSNSDTIKIEIYFKISRSMENEDFGNSNVNFSFFSEIERAFDQFLSKAGPGYTVSYYSTDAKEDRFVIDIKTINRSLVHKLAKWLHSLFVFDNFVFHGTVNNVSSVMMTNTMNSDDLTCGGMNLAIHRDKQLFTLDNEEMRVIIGRNRSFDLSLSRYTVTFFPANKSVNVNLLAYCYENVNCTLLIFDKREFEYSNGSIMLKHNATRLPDNSFILMNGYLYVCRENVLIHDDLSPPSLISMIKSILTKVVLSISTLCLWALVCLHVVYPKFLNLHGKCLVSFSISLMVGQILIIIVDYISGLLCAILSAVGHYAWLSSFLWCGVMAFDMAGRFHTKTMMMFRSSNEQTRFKKYSLVAWICPLVIVTICCILNFGINNRLVGYGWQGTCWIVNGYALLVAFVVPVAIIMMMNIVCLIITMTGIETAKRATKNLTKSRADKSRLFMYIKLALLLGLTWVFSFMTYNLNTDALYIIQILLNGSQGTLLLLHFLSNAKSIDFKRKRSQKSSKLSSSFSNVSTISSTGI